MAHGVHKVQFYDPLNLVKIREPPVSRESREPGKSFLGPHEPCKIREPHVPREPCNFFLEPHESHGIVNVMCYEPCCEHLEPWEQGADFLRFTGYTKFGGTGETLKTLPKPSIKPEKCKTLASIPRGAGAVGAPTAPFLENFSHIIFLHQNLPSK